MPRRTKSQEVARPEVAHAMKELPYLMQFLHLHRQKFKFIKLSMKELEGSVVNNDSLVLPDILTRLLRFLDNDQTILISNFETQLDKLLSEKLKDNNPLSSGKFSDLKPDDKVQLLRWLIDYVYDEKNDDLTDQLNDSFSSDDMRAINVGQDAFGNTYWYFDDLRLYRESATSKSGRKEWDCICIALNDWHTFLNKYKKSAHQAEKELFEYLNNELFPVIEPQLKQEKDLCEKNLDLERDAILSKEKADTEGMIKKEKPEEISLPDVKLEPITNGNDTPKEGIVTEDVNTASVKSEAGTLPDEKPPVMNDGAALQGQIQDKKNIVKAQHAPFHISNPHHASQRALSSMEAPFMQQQSQIFVFSTTLANKAAESVLRGQFKSIIAYHLEEPGTKKFLQKHPLKISQFNRQPGFPMFPNANMRNPGPQGLGAGSPRPVGPWMGDQPGLAPGGPSPNGGMQINPNMPQHSPNMMPGWQGQSGNQNAMMAQQYAMMGSPNMGPQGPGSGHMNLSQTKVPNENLTPEQLQRREEHLASLRKIHQMLFPEQAHDQPGHMNPGMPPGSGPHPGQGMPMGPNQMQAAMQNMPPNQGNMMNRGNFMSMMGSQQQMMGAGGAPPQLSPAELQNLPPAQREWYRLQHEFYHEKRRQHMAMAAQNSPYFPNNPMNMNSPNSSGQGPPPSYFSTIAQKRGASGPPGSLPSPTSPSFNGPMPSPHGAMPSPHMSSAHQSPVPGEPHFSFPSQKRPPSQPYQSMVQSPGMVGSPGFNPSMPGVNMPPYNDTMMRPMGPNQEGFVQRASSPEQFLDPSANNVVGAKPPPTYGQATKRRKTEHIPAEEITKNLQPTPSPQQINYLQQFEGQELTITKQVNLAYQDSGGGCPCSGAMCGVPHNTQTNVAKNSTAPSTPSSVTSPGHVPPTGQNTSSGGPLTPIGQQLPQKMPSSNHMPGQVTPEVPLSSPNQMPKSGGMSSSTGMPSPFSPSHVGRTPTVSKGNGQQPIPSPVHYGQMPSPAQVPTPGSVPRSNTMTSGNHNGPGTPLGPGSQLSNVDQRSNQGQMPVTSPMSNQSQMSINSPCPVSSASQRSSTDSLSNASQGQMSRPPSLSGSTGGTQRLTHFDPPSISSAPGTPATPTTTTKSNTMSNITSASLANLAKGVEHLSNQMQQNMMQGGPFHNIQIQGQVTEKSVPSPQQQQSPLQPQPSQTVSNSPSSQQTPSVNNTYVNATMSIQQLNIQSVNNPNATANMQAQQTNSDMGVNLPLSSATISQMQSQSMMSGSQVSGPQLPTAMMQQQQQQQKVMTQQHGMGSTPAMNQVPGQQPARQHVGGPQQMGGPPQPVGAQQMASQQMDMQQMNMQQMAGQQQMNMQSMHGQQFSGQQMTSQQFSAQQIAAQQMSGGSMRGLHPMPGQSPMDNLQMAAAMAGEQPFPNPQLSGHPMANPQMKNPQQSLTPNPMPGMPTSQTIMQQMQSMMTSQSQPMSRQQQPRQQQQQLPQQQQPQPQQQQQQQQQQNPAPVGNANVQIQSKAPNTIQYLPANPPTSQPNRFPPKLPDFDTSFGNTNMDMKTPTSKLQYFPNNDGQNSMPPINCMPNPNQPMGLQESVMMGNRMPHSRLSPMQYHARQHMHPGAQGRFPPSGNPQGMPYGPGGMGPGNPAMMGNQMDLPGPGGPMDPMAMMGGNNSMGQHVQIQGQQMSMQGGPMNMPQQAGGQPMEGSGPYGMSPRPNQPNYSMQYQQFQQQLYAQNRTRQMNPAQMGNMGPMGMSPQFPNFM